MADANYQPHINEPRTRYILCTTTRLTRGYLPVPTENHRIPELIEDCRGAEGTGSVRGSISIQGRRIDFTLHFIFVLVLISFSCLLLIPPNRSEHGGSWLGAFNRAWIGEDVDGIWMVRTTRAWLLVSVAVVRHRFIKI